MSLLLVLFAGNLSFISMSFVGHCLLLIITYVSARWLPNTVSIRLVFTHILFGSGVQQFFSAAQVPDYVIMAMGGWASAVYLQYISPSMQIYAAAQDALANASFINAQSIRAVHSHVQPVLSSYNRELYHNPTRGSFVPAVQFANILDL